MTLPAHYKLIKLDVVDSTNLEAIRLIKDNRIGEEPVVIFAKSQTSGMGRLGRKWISEAGNLFISVIYRVGESGIHSSDISVLPFITAIAVGDTLKKYLQDGSIKYKWPNDVLVDGRKISGVLIEIIAGYIVIGVGINITSYPLENIKFPATCVNNNTNIIIDVEDVFEMFLTSLDRRIYAGHSGLLDEWVKCAYGINENVTISQAEKKISGIYRGVDQNGRLILELEEGRREVVFHGDVSWI